MQRWPRSRGVVSSSRRWAPLTGQIALAALLQGIFCSSGWLEAAEMDRHLGKGFQPVPAESVPNPLSDPAALAQALSRLLGPAESPTGAGLRGSFLRVGAGLDGGEGARPALGGRTRSDRAGRAPNLPSRPAPTLGNLGKRHLNLTPIGAGGEVARATRPAEALLAAVLPGPALAASEPAKAKRPPPPPIPPPPSLPGLPEAKSRAVRSAAPATAAAIAPAAGGVPLVPGWNLISLPKQPDSVDPAAVFSSISGSFTVVHAYDACNATDPWRTYNPGAADNDLTSVDHRIGLWVQATAAATLAVSGTEPAETSIHLCQGWNLIGYPLAQPRPVLAALSSIAGKFRRVYGYDPNDPADPWEVFDTAVPTWANDLELMQPGHGYWLYATEDTTLVMSNAGLPPEVAITAPANAAAVTAPTDVVGTVQSNLLQGWTLAYRSKGETGSTIFASGNTPVINGALGKFDPTLLLNGLYEIELTATDFQGQSVSTAIDVAVEGNLKIGNFTLSFVDLEVPVAGLPIQVIRTYDSRDKELGDFGIGWRVSVSNVRLQEDGPVGENWQGVRSGGTFSNYCVFPSHQHQVTITLPDGKVLRFQPKLTPECQAFAPPQVVTISYVPLPGTLGKLEMLDQNPQALVVGSFPGSVRLLDEDSVELTDPGRYRLTTQDGRAFVVDQLGGLITLTDLNGNKLTFGRNGITHSSGKGVTFERDAQGKITRIIDPAGESLTYSYNTAVDLVAVADREKAATRFTYNNNHYLLSIQDPLGRQPIRNEYDASGRLVSTTDAFGKKIELTYSLAANREVVTDRLGYSRVLEYDARGNVIRETNALGKVTSRTFDSNDHLVSETDPLGHTTKYTYDSSQNLASVTDPLGGVTLYTHNELGQVLTMTDPSGKTTRNTYDTAGNLLQSQDPLVNVTTFTYDSRGNLLSQIDAVGARATYSYSSSGDLLQQTDPSGVNTTFTYDVKGNRLTQTSHRTTRLGIETLVWTYEHDAQGRVVRTVDPDGIATHSLYDALGNVVESIDKLGRSTRFIFDEMGRRIATQFPDGTAQTSTYDAEGRRLTDTDRGGQTTRHIYDPVGHLLTTIYPDGASVSNTYDDAGQLVAMINARGNMTGFGYDAAGRRVLIRDALGNETLLAYDANGNLIATTDPRKNNTTFEYDSANHLVQVHFPNGASSRTVYDRVGRRISEIDAAGETTQFGYDPLGRLLTVTDALAKTTSYRYDEQGNRVEQIDATGKVTRFEYDKLGHQIQRILPSGESESFTYDAAGNRKTHRDFSGAVTIYTYDIADHPVSRHYPDGSSVSFTYTAGGRRATAIDGRGITSYFYDSRNRLIRLTYPDGRELRYSYDLQGNRISLSAQIGAAVLTTAFTYDALDRLSKVTDPNGRTYIYAYDENGNRSLLVYPNGVRTSYTYDVLNHLTSLVTVTSSNSQIQSYIYTLGPSGNRTRVDEGDGTSRTYSYDSLYRLATEEVTHDGTVVFRRVLTYDPVGNRLQEEVGSSGTTRVIAYAYDARDRLRSAAEVNHEWDANGNLLARSAPEDGTYSWDYENRLVKVVLANGTSIRHTYDADGIRVRTEVTPVGGPTKATEYLVDPEYRTSRVGWVMPLSQVVAESESASLSTYYVRGDDLLATIRPSTVRFFHAEGLGSVRVLTDEAQNVTDRYTFDAFGTLLGHIGSDSNTHLFVGEQVDPSSGFYYNRARWMLGGSGTFASMDLFPGRPFEPWTLHRYLYADANPVNKIDPTGYQGELTNFTIASAITIIIAGTIIGYAYTGTVKGGLLGAAAGTGIAVALLSRSPELFRRTLMGGFINAFWYRVGLSVREYLGSPLPPHYEETVLQAFIAGELSGVFSWKAADYFSPETAQYLGGIVNAGLTSLLTGKCLRDAIYGAFLSIPASAFKNMIFSDFAVPLFQVPFDAESWFKIAMDEAFKSISSLIKPPLLEAIRAWKPEMATAIECK